MEPDIVIRSEGDWQLLRSYKIDTIVDPMIVRSADLWLQGRSVLKGQDAEPIWTALSQNIDSLEAFFDAFLLSERLPLVDYWATFDANLGYEPESLYRRINEAAEEKIFINVHIRDAASWSASQHARDILAQHQATGEKELVSAVADEFSAYGHQWKPDLRYLGTLSPEQTHLAEFQYGLLLFGHFATSAKVGHLIQAKRARLFAAGAVDERTPGYEFDAKLREQLQRIVESEEKRFGVMLNLDACPSFLPYLLGQSDNTAGLLTKAIELRRDPMLSDYRAWRTRIISEWQDSGRIASETERELRKATDRVLHKLGVGASPSEYKIGFNALFLTGEAPAEKLTGWIPFFQEGRRHAKLLMRSIKAGYEFKNLEDAVKNRWSNT